MGTKMGEIAHLLKTAEKGASPLQDKLHRLGKLLGFFSLAISILVFIIGTAAGTGLCTPLALHFVRSFMTVPGLNELF